jgi:hypothetical protein
MARPRKEIDQKAFEKLCGLQCTQQEICDWFDCDDVTLNSWCKRTYHKGFSEVFAQKRGKGRVSLRRSQWQAAEKGNASLLIWLGKQWLGQKEKPDESVDTEDSDAYFTEAGLNENGDH